MLMPPSMTISVLPDELAICRLDPGGPIPPMPAPNSRGPLWSLTVTPEEVAVICTADQAPRGARAEFGWRAFKVEGPLEFEIVGILESLLQPLVDARINVFAISTFDTDYVLVRAGDVRPASTALRVAGHTVQPDRAGHAGHAGHAVKPDHAGRA
jgi:hypothetical protein